MVLDFDSRLCLTLSMASIITRFLHYIHLLRRSHTLGVRAIVRDGEGRVFLVKHTYVPGWYLPGGGVEWGETFADALTKELREEANIHLTGEGRLIALYQNRNTSKRDHVALYECPDWHQPAPPKVPNREILDAGFFNLDDLPDGISDATKRRLTEAAQGGPYSAYW